MSEPQCEPLILALDAMMKADGELRATAGSEERVALDSERSWEDNEVVVSGRKRECERG